MEPQDIIWRITEHLSALQKLLVESQEELHPKKNSDLISSLQECEQLAKTQLNTLNRVAKKY